jgi:hypothetical protein
MKSRFYEISFGKVSWAASLVLVEAKIVVQVERKLANRVCLVGLCGLVGAKIAVQRRRRRRRRRRKRKTAAAQDSPQEGGAEYSLVPQATLGARVHVERNLANHVCLAGL